MECIEHPMPLVPDGLPDDAPEWDELEAWEENHFYVGEEGFNTCEENRLFDICTECTIRKQERLEDNQFYVKWHGYNSIRDSSR
jgi:hypothetical protein